MGHRTQLYLDDAQHAWLRRRAEERGSIAAVVRDLIDAARQQQPGTDEDPLIEYLLDAPPADGGAQTSVASLDDELYGG